jgi:HrpA-like RNA helicase
MRAWDGRLRTQLLASGQFKCSEEVATIAAMLSVQVRLPRGAGPGPGAAATH